MINTVYLDIDGVLADFTQGVFRAVGRKYDYNDPVLKNWMWYGDIGFDLPQIDSLCNINFWAGLPWMHDGKEILQLVERAFNNIYLLTTPMPNPGSYTGKMLWIERHLPKYINRTIITQIPKQHFANVTSLLIDDRYENCYQFQNAGGLAILVPRPWNGGGLTLPTLTESLKELTQ